jgi:hypothetical protein
MPQMQLHALNYEFNSPLRARINGSVRLVGVGPRPRPTVKRPVGASAFNDNIVIVSSDLSGLEMMRSVSAVCVCVCVRVGVFDVCLLQQNKRDEDKINVMKIKMQVCIH